MLFLLLITTLLNPFRPCEGPPTFQEEYRGSYVPNVIKTGFGLQVVVPDTPYVAVADLDQLYFIDTWLDTETAKHASVPKEDEYIAIDEISATAEVKISVTGETTFVFDPAFARVAFSRGMNRHNPELKLPEPEPAGDWLVTYDLGNSLLGNTSEAGG
ncbi:hypothetical protein N7449_003196 [Penicillium cf. viridicatum]|uniref:Uncharacterized protein n=1 Tax=Penicillium cf. viridicatum TaxID=2972119 RepID=A0A9W9T451_9EURO|nr:hypothetical protein N7449_003196 [Penicillium cf. viridicatum]